MGIWEPDHFLEVTPVNLPKHRVHRQVPRRIPHIVDHALEARCVVRQRQLACARIRTLQSESMPQPFRRIPPVRVGHKVRVIRRQGTCRQKLVHPA